MYSGGMEQRQLAIAEFRASATRIIREVEESKVPVVLTRHGVPVVEIRPVKDTDSSLRGTVAFSPEYDPTAPAAPSDDWESS